MLQLARQARAAMSLLNPKAVRGLAQRPCCFRTDLANARRLRGDGGFSSSRGAGREVRVERYGLVHRAGDPNPPARKSTSRCTQRAWPPARARTRSRREGPRPRAVAAMPGRKRSVAVPLARQFPVFARHAVVDRIIHASTMGEHPLRTGRGAARHGAHPSGSFVGARPVGFPTHLVTANQFAVGFPDQPPPAAATPACAHRKPRSG